MLLSTRVAEALNPARSAHRSRTRLPTAMLRWVTGLFACYAGRHVGTQWVIIFEISKIGGNRVFLLAARLSLCCTQVLLVYGACIVEYQCLQG